MNQESDVRDARESLLPDQRLTGWPSHDDVDPRSMEGCYYSSSDPTVLRRGLRVYPAATERRV